MKPVWISVVLGLAALLLIAVAASSGGFVAVWIIVPMLAILWASNVWVAHKRGRAEGAEFR